jgi:hypothetical protein
MVTLIVPQGTTSVQVAHWLLSTADTSSNWNNKVYHIYKWIHADYYYYQVMQGTRLIQMALSFFESSTKWYPSANFIASKNAGLLDSLYYLLCSAPSTSSIDISKDGIETCISTRGGIYMHSNSYSLW